MQIKSWQIVLVSPFIQAAADLLNFVFNAIIMGKFPDNDFQKALSENIVSIMNSLSFYMLSITLVSLLYYKESKKIAAFLLILFGIYEILSGNGFYSGIFSVIAVAYYIMYESKTQKDKI